MVRILNERIRNIENRKRTGKVVQTYNENAPRRTNKKNTPDGFEEEKKRETQKDNWGN